MKLGLLYPGAFAGLFIVVATARCTPQQAKSAVGAVAQDVLPVAQLICVETAPATTLEGVKQACDGIDALTPSEINFVLQLLEQKRAAQKMGFAWKADAGAGAGNGK